MKSLKSAARRGAIISVAAMSALSLAACSAGHITQTSQKVIAVDGTNAKTEDGAVAVRDVTIQLEPNDGTASLKFSVINDGYADGKVTLQSIDVDGQSVNVSSTQPIGRGQSIIGDSKANLEATPKDETNDAVQYVTTDLTNEDYAFGGTRPVTFTFNNGELTVDAPVSASPLTSGQYNRDSSSTEGYTTETAKAEHH
ncbi:hypothetical protein ACEE90_07895 [Corynebacterium phoceense]|uniref:hypothetical protein n=1 Tax=Corynebacterium TaxID=1716 RepID=UPI001DB928B0|nr:hypothetical protein [Corynebacterium phoceense]MCQ9333672.1 hypothetical protein [Corynebacterium phoceense]MCQ9335189.1 hypothetical protein [Corynebacterium phoceense]HJG43148.1 hypothetical protein [Corynebacterium phoceense]